MSYKQIDEQFYKKFTYGGITGRVAFDPDKDYPIDVLEFIHLIYDQAKAEQREEDARIAEGMNVGEEAGFVLSLPKFVKRDNEMFNGGYNRAVADIAKAIRQD